MISDVLSIVLVGDDVEKGEDETEEHGKGVRRGKGGQRGTALAPLVCIFSSSQSKLLSSKAFSNLALVLHICMNTKDVYWTS